MMLLAFNTLWIVFGMFDCLSCFNLNQTVLNVHSFDLLKNNLWFNTFEIQLNVHIYVYDHLYNQFYVNSYKPYYTWTMLNKKQENAWYVYCLLWPCMCDVTHHGHPAVLKQGCDPMSPIKPGLTLTRLDYGTKGPHKCTWPAIIGVIYY